MHRSATGGGLVLFAAVALALSAPAAAEAQALGFVETLIVDGVMVNVLQLSGGSRGSSASSSVMRGYARNIAGNTGGVYETFSAVTGMAEWMRRYAERLNVHYAEVSKRYRVLYEPPDPRGARISAGARPGVNIRLFVDLRAAEQ